MHIHCCHIVCYLDTVFQCPGIVWMRQLDDFQFVGFLHVFDPLVGLTLGVNHQWPPVGRHHNDGIVHRVAEKH